VADEDARVQAVLLLGGSLLDYLDQPRQPSSTLGTEPGLSSSREVPCTACQARGRMKGSNPCVRCLPRTGTNPVAIAYRTDHGCTPCLGCDGTGWRRRRKADPVFDSYAGAELDSFKGKSDRKRWEELQDLERRLAHTERVLAEYEGRSTAEVGWETRRAAQWRQGSYADLVKAMRVLEETMPDAHSLFWRHVVLGGYGRLSERLQTLVYRTARYIAYSLMPGPEIRVPRALRGDQKAADAKESLWRGRSAAHELARRERDQLILHQRHVLHWKVARIARYHALEERTVKRITATASAAA
jgi:hypothetical protein